MAVTNVMNPDAKARVTNAETRGGYQEVVVGPLRILGRREGLPETDLQVMG